MKTILTPLLLIALTFGCKSSTDNNSSPTTFTGTSTAISNGTANTYITMDASGNLSAIGVMISDGALQSLGNMDTMFELAMPSGVTTQFRSVSLDYAVHDQAPFNHPHLDPHFFLIDMNARMGIMDMKDTTKPMNMTMPAGYATDWMSEMMMGVHWMDTSAAPYHNQPYQCSVAYGTRMGMLDFMELMCDKASLDGHKSISGGPKTPTMGMASNMMVTMPTFYSIGYDTTAKKMKIELEFESKVIF